MQFLLVAGVILAVSSAATLTLEDLEFHAWKLKFGKVYSSATEEAHRKDVWLTNRKLVLVHNILADQGIKSFRLGMTSFADMDRKEYGRFISRGRLRSSNSSMPRRTGSAYLPPAGGIKLPTAVDWRDRGYVTDVKDQGYCGSCWAFSATGSLEGQHFRQTGKLVILSEQQLVDCSGSYGNEGCDGGDVDQAFNYIGHGGLDTEESYPYEDEEGDCRFDPSTVGASLSGWVDLTGATEELLQNVVASEGPVSVSIDADHSSFQHFKSVDVYDEPECSSSQSDLDHSVLVVGYGTTKDGLDYWLVKNSWGEDWGDMGYIKMSRNKDNQCGIATEALYPLV